MPATTAEPDGTPTARWEVTGCAHCSRTIYRVLYDGLPDPDLPWRHLRDGAQECGRRLP